MILFRRPSDSVISDFLSSQVQSDYSYAQVGATRQGPSGCSIEGFVIDQNRRQIGEGVSDFERAKQAFMQWRHLQLGWLEPCWPDTDVKLDSVIGIVATWAGVWFLAACRVVYVFEEVDGPIQRFGFAYGTLADHAECGEERFMLEFDERTQAVDYEIFAFSRPNKWYTKLGYPLVRRQQKRFARESIETLQKAVLSDGR